MEKGKKKFVFGVTLFVLLIFLPLMYVGVQDFLLGNKISLDLCNTSTYHSNILLIYNFNTIISTLFAHQNL